MVERKASLSVRCQCNLVSVNRGSFYYQPVAETEENLKVMRLMDEHYLKHPTEGVIRMRDFLMTLGTIANHKRIRSHTITTCSFAILSNRNRETSLDKRSRVKFCFIELARIKIDSGTSVNIDNSSVFAGKYSVYIS